MMKVLLIAALVGAASAAYPAQQPLQNEAYQGVDLVDLVPDNLYTDEEQGGYLYYYCWKLTIMDNQTLQDTDMPYAPQHNTWVRWLLVKQFGAPPVLPDSLWNCTAKDLFFKHNDYTGIIDGNTVCEAGDCCMWFIGQVKYSDDQLDWHQWLDELAAPAICDPISEHAYCILVGGDFQLNCHEFVTDPEVRYIYTFPCFDQICNWYMACNLFKGTFTTTTPIEPGTYYSLLSNEQLMNHETNSALQDRVCNPYSYYFPETAIGGGDSPAPSGSSPKASTKDDDSSAMTVGIVVAALLALAM